MTNSRCTLLAGALALTLLAGGCAKYHLVSPEPEPGTESETATMHAYLWGAIESEQPATHCDKAGMEEVRVHQTLPNVLATVVTLGIWMPLKVEWRCAKEPQKEGTGF